MVCGAVPGRVTERGKKVPATSLRILLFPAESLSSAADDSGTKEPHFPARLITYFRTRLNTYIVCDDVAMMNSSAAYCVNDIPIKKSITSTRTSGRLSQEDAVQADSCIFYICKFQLVPHIMTPFHNWIESVHLLSFVVGWDWDDDTTRIRPTWIACPKEGICDERKRMHKLSS